MTTDPFFDLDATFGQPTNDTIVGSTSQYGKLASGSAATTFINSVIHAALGVPGEITETTSNEIKQRVSDLLISSDPNEFAPGFPAPVSGTPALPFAASARRAPAAAAPTGTERIHITAPSVGTSFPHQATTTITLSAEALGGAAPEKVLFVVEKVGAFVATSAQNHSVDFAVPTTAPIGALNVVAMALDPSGALLSDSTTFTLDPPGTPSSLRLEPENIVLTPDAPSQSLHAFADFGDGRLVEISKSDQRHHRRLDQPVWKPRIASGKAIASSM